MSQSFYKPKISILSAGDSDVLSEKENTANFIDISISNGIQIDSGEYSMIVLTRQGHVYGRGKNQYGELGMGDKKERNAWTQIPIPYKVKQVSCKHTHSLFLTEEGHVYSCGRNICGQLGIGNIIDQNIVQPILINKKAIKVVTGLDEFSFVLCKVSKKHLCDETQNDLCKKMNHIQTGHDLPCPNLSMTIDSCNDYECDTNTMLYAFGCNFAGQLGINRDDRMIIKPALVEFFNDKSPIQDIQAGSSHSIVLLQDGSLYAMGVKQRCGQEPNHNGHFYSPVLVSIGVPVKSICCSYLCTIFQTIKNKYYAFGDVYNQKYPICGKKISLTPERIDDVFPQGIQVKKMVATSNTLFLLTYTNDLYVVGQNRHSEIGANKICEKWTHFKSNILDIQTGPYNSFLFLIEPFTNSKMKCFTDVFIKIYS